jgi:exosortase
VSLSSFALSRPAWRLLVTIVLLSVSWTFGLSDVLLALHESWTTLYGPFEHGYVVLGMGIWIAVHNWLRDPVFEFAPWSPALLPLVACSLALAVMELLLMNSARFVLLPLFFVTTVAAGLGRKAAMRVAGGTLFIYFALPQWWVINELLQGITVLTVGTMLDLGAVPAFIEDSHVRIPSGVFEIASGCSGLNYLMAGCALAAFFALTRLESWRHRILLTAVAGVASVVFNWLRVLLIIVIGHQSEMQHYLVRVEHHSFGWLLFLVSLAPVFGLAMRLENRELHRRADSPGPKRGVAALIRYPSSALWIVPLVALILLAPLALSNTDAPATGSEQAESPVRSQ